MKHISVDLFAATLHTEVVGARIAVRAVAVLTAFRFAVTAEASAAEYMRAADAGIICITSAEASAPVVTVDDGIVAYIVRARDDECTYANGHGRCKQSHCPPAPSPGWHFGTVLEDTYGPCRRRSRQSLHRHGDFVRTERLERGCGLCRACVVARDSAVFSLNNALATVATGRRTSHRGVDRQVTTCAGIRETM